MAKIKTSRKQKKSSENIPNVQLTSNTGIKAYSPTAEILLCKSSTNSHKLGRYVYNSSKEKACSGFAKSSSSNLFNKAITYGFLSSLSCSSSLVHRA